MLRGKNILIGVTASIAAYKSAALIRLLKKAGAHVKVIMTPASFDFITPLTLSTLSQEPVLSSFKNEGETWNNHVELGLWADLMMIAPASANTISKMANGACDNLLIATYLSARCKVAIAPAMDLDMFVHPSVQLNLEKLTSFGNAIIEPGTGELASGLEGKGRMEEPEVLVDWMEDYFSPKKHHFVGKKILVTAGPTFEPLDPVRFIGNHSSGKMGCAIAKEASSQGADVVLIHGPIDEKLIPKNVQSIAVQTAEDMFKACKAEYSTSDIVIMSAAVADYSPEKTEEEKIKKKEDSHSLKLKSTVDILAYLGQVKQRQILVGFAMETQNLEQNAFKKVKKKNLDFIVLNSLKEKGAGFKKDTNKVSFIDPQNNVEHFELKSKREVAVDILNKIEHLLN